ncbi:uncharacterized protein PV06_07820 [Exophiala oligosperma]|uniref:F-box domain-containing protein n=1 Tax=Exophiala oligosperma TaxID=215243 RepID=A0A0D2DDX5_9EURO|nr:uncharacterized protein PV06_07820 [Exophiala oligosperma]KIW40640.1 hypothetical protein PV06_07820 [Exophiala oligosperma]
MDRLPEEIVVDILDHLEPKDLISVRKTCTTLAKSAHINRLWRNKCFEKSPSASMRRNPGTLTDLTSALQGLTLSERTPATRNHQSDSDGLMRESPRARAINQWDQSAQDEIVDWYSEYKSRHAPLSADWAVQPPARQLEIKGVATLGGSEHAVGYLEDASICLWDLSASSTGRRTMTEIGRSKPGVLFTDGSQASESLVVDCVSTVSSQQKAFIAIGDILNEIDLNTLKVVSHSKYAYPITALSQSTGFDLPLTVGTQWSLHILDPRLSVSIFSKSPSECVEEVPAVSGKSTAILPDFSQTSIFAPSSNFGPAAPFTSDHNPPAWTPRVSNLPPSHHRQNPHWMAYARVEPGPLSILHHADNEILLAGRFSSILSYDRRFFPRLQYVIHSGGSLSSLASIPHPPAGSPASVSGGSTLVACGEYRGRGSLELYSLPHTKPGQPSLNEDTISRQPSTDDILDLGRTPSTSSDGTLFSYKNRQEAASSKLLSVASHGTKIVFSDSEGGLKWVERDGRSLVRKWNLNDFEVSETGASIHGDKVARKIIPLESADSEYRQRGDADLLIWTGEKIGIITTNPQFMDHQEMVKALEEGEDANEREERERAEEYSKTMRRALERQADERRWMSQFRLKRGYF